MDNVLGFLLLLHVNCRYIWRYIWIARILTFLKRFWIEKETWKQGFAHVRTRQTFARKFRFNFHCHYCYDEENMYQSDASNGYILNNGLPVAIILSGIYTRGATLKSQKTLTYDDPRCTELWWTKKHLFTDILKVLVTPFVKYVPIPLVEHQDDHRCRATE